MRQAGAVWTTRNIRSLRKPKRARRGRAMNKNLALSLTALALSACGWLAPSFHLPEVAPKDTPLASDMDSEFVSPTVVGSWQLVDHEALKVEHGTPWYRGLNIPGLD